MAAPTILDSTASVADSDNASSVTISGYTPPAGSNRKVIVMAGVFNDPVTGTTLTCSFGGTSMEKIDQVQTGSFERFAIFQALEADFPGGGSGDIVFDVASSSSDVAAVAFTIQDAEQVALASMDTPVKAGSASASITPSAANSLVLGFGHGSVSASAANWSAGLTRLGVTGAPGAGSWPYAGGSDTSTILIGYAAQGASSLTCTHNMSTGRPGIILAAFQEATGGTTVTGSGGVTLSVPTIAGAGVREVTGSGGVALPAPTIAASGVREITGSGGVTSTVPTIAATGLREVTGAGAITATVPTIAASGLRDVTGSGAVTITVPTIAGAGIREVVGTGSVIVPTITIDASGSIGGVISGSGGVSMPMAVISASGVREVIGSAGITATVPTISASGSKSSTVDGAGAVTVAVPTIAGAGVRVIVGTGGGVIGIPAIAAQGAREIVGTGGVTVPVATISGSDTITLFAYVALTGNPDAPTVLIGNPDAPTAITGNPDAPSSITGDAAMDAQNLSGFTWGADLVIDLTAKNADGTALSSPGTQTIKIAIGATQAGAALLDFDDKATHSGSSVFRITLAPADYTATLKEGRPYYYTIWSQLGAASPIPQAKGTFTIGASIAAA